MYKPKVQGQSCLLVYLISRYLVDASRVNCNVGGAKEKWPSWWFGRLGDGVRYLLSR